MIQISTMNIVDKGFSFQRNSMLRCWEILVPWHLVVFDRYVDLT